MKISVLMATYNGEEFIEQQLDSILSQLNIEDELLISDDGSKDNTLNIIHRYMDNYKNIRLIYGPYRGSTANFTAAIPKTKGDLIIFADQDDLWVKNKVNIVRDFFKSNPHTALSMHDGGFCDGNGQIQNGGIFARRKPKHGFIHNLVHSAYYGCCMTVTREFLMQYIPLSDETVAFDQYFSLLAEYKEQAAFINEKLIWHRYHGENQSQKQGVVGMINFRLKLVKSVILALRSGK